MKRTCALALVVIAAAFGGPPDDEWPAYGRDPGGQRFSPLTAINRENVGSLKVAWTYRTGDGYQPKNGNATAFEATPLYVDGSLYLSTPLGHVVALNPVTGKVLWSYDAGVPKDAGYGDFANRGVSTWKPVKGARRIIAVTVDARLLELDAATGKAIASFGENGEVNLRNGLRIAPRNFSDYEETSPPAIAGDTIVVGSGIADNRATDQPSGEVRGYDAITGKLKWTWHPISADPKAPGAANTWSVIAADPERGLVFLPVGSPSPDYYGGERPGDNLYANSIVALKASTGERVWHFQTVHHDLWDYDVASPPILFDVHRNGRTIPAVGAGSKTGNFFILDRVTGKPIFGVEERAVPQSDVAGEKSSPSQPFPVSPKPLAAQSIAKPWGANEADRAFCTSEMAKLRNEGIFTPPSVRGSYVIPGNVGGMAWGGAAFDPGRHLLFIPTNNIGSEVRLIPRADFERERDTERRKLNGDWEFAEQRGTPYGMARRLLLSPGLLPCVAPPWGVLNAVDANTGELKWSTPTGIFRAGVPGSLSLGGPIATAGGLVFMAGTLDAAIYAFDAETGKQLWRGELPTSARSTPMTYRGPDGRQYLLISAGGHGNAAFAPLGDYLVAFALPSGK
ncbi:MAG TPA: pyrroloquinoline quinone-dependent dehydrogenase [Bryobacteraceae bacterium]|nr:pyrroloquinoline quinone-dependent dehydrogenase [Bryobacteraceae bacterium]